jgi:hypothetical protein
MVKVRSSAVIAAFAVASIAALLVFRLAPATAAEGDVPGVPTDNTSSQPQPQTGDDNSASEDHSPKSPIRVNTIDYQEANGGTLKLAGIAAPGSPLYLFFDNEPLAKVDADNSGNWSLEQPLKLDEAQHTLRAEQYDPTTQMLSGRAMITISRAPSADQGAVPPGNGEAPKTDTP